MPDWQKYDRLREAPIGVRLPADDLAWVRERMAATGDGFSRTISRIVHEYRMQSEQMQTEQMQTEEPAN